jgi:hypothetical protein
MTKTFGILNFGHCYLPFDLAQGGESFDFAQDRELVERLVEPFDIWDLLFGIFVTAPIVILILIRIEILKLIWNETIAFPGT